jgi:hypothetical protein
MDRLYETLKSCIDDEMRKSEAIGDFVATFESFDDSEMSEKFQHQEKLIAEFQEILKKDEEKMNFTELKFDIELLPILEYFMIEAVQKKQSINVEYLAELPSIDSNVAVLNDLRFKLLQNISCDDSATKEFDENFLTLMMKIDCGVQKVIQQSLAVNSMLCRSFNDEENYNLSSNILATLLGPNGSISGTGLREINQWKRMMSHLKREVRKFDL